MTSTRGTPSSATAYWGTVTIPSTSSHTVGEEARQLFQGRGPEIDRQWHRNPGKVEGVVTETVDVLGVIGTQPRQGRPIGRHAFGGQLVQAPGHGHEGVKDQQVGRKVIVLDQLALLVPHALAL